MEKILIIGAVTSTQAIIYKLLYHKFNIVGIIGYKPSNVENVSGWVDLEVLSKSNCIDFIGFIRINDSEILHWARSKRPDLIFAVGFSQLLSKEWFEIPKFGCIGFHPTALPKGRGRAPIAWNILCENEGAATFFLMNENADDGPIFSQKKFIVEKNDDAKSIEDKIIYTINQVLDEWLPELKNGIWNPIPQTEANATWYGKRQPEDGLIDWSKSCYVIDKLIRASTFPHPGAYTFFKNQKIKILESEIDEELPIKGVVGRVLKIDTRGILIQCGLGLLWLKNIYPITSISKIKVGDRLGFQVEEEIFKIWREIKLLKNE